MAALKEGVCGVTDMVGNMNHLELYTLCLSISVSFSRSGGGMDETSLLSDRPENLFLFTPEK